MPGLRDHEPVIIENFNGLWKRGDEESCPSDHFVQADNIQFFTSGFETRDSLSPYPFPFNGRILRMYDYVMPQGQSLLVMTTDGVTQSIWHLIPPDIVYGPLWWHGLVTDFGFVEIGGRAYITPFHSVLNAQGMRYEIGIPNEFVYVYKGDGYVLRKAAGFPPTNGGKRTFLAYNSATDGKVDKGIHSIAVTYNGGWPGPQLESDPTTINTEMFRIVNAQGEKQIQIDNLPLGPSGVTSRQIQMTKAIPPEAFNPSPLVYTYYTALNIADNTTTSVRINITDAELITPYTPGADAAPTTGALVVSNTVIDGFCDFGFHLVAVIYETDTGYLTAPGPEFFGGQTYTDVKKSIRVSNIPVSPNSFVKKRHLVSTKAIAYYNGDQKGYQFFFIPEGNIENNTDTTKLVNYYDADLLDDASHLIDNFSEIPACVNLTTYHSRMVLVGEHGTTESLQGVEYTQVDNRCIARLSAPGEPEAVNKVDGIIVTPLDGSPLTNAQEFRDVLYLFKRTRTYAYSDNNDEPTTWKEEVIDHGLGTAPHGIGKVLDSGGVNIDYLIIANWSGMFIFNGVYARPELTWKIEDFWKILNRNDFRLLQVINNPIEKKLWIVLPYGMSRTVLHGDYGEGLDAKNIKWAKWIFDADMHCATLFDTNKLLLAGSTPPLEGIHFIEKRVSPRDNYKNGTILKIPNPTVSMAYFGE